MKDMLTTHLVLSNTALWKSSKISVSRLGGAGKFLLDLKTL
jgi:hypothetical protein